MMSRKWLASLFVFMCLCILNLKFINADDESVNKSSKCKTLFTFGYGYRQFFHLSPQSTHQSNGDLLNMKFMVKARSDAHILLSPSPSPEEVDPVYEIVLGAGKNSFSDIRRKRRSSTKSSAYTKDLLSGIDMRGFWVKINSEGIIMVGNEGNDLPFMEWQDPEPLLIEYFSFCTWSGVAGKWLYDCLENEQTGSVIVQPVLSGTQKLRQALLTNYDTYSSPIINNSQPMEINLQLKANYIHLDVEQSVMTLGCEFKLEWYDSKTVWNPDDYEGIEKLYLLHHEIWQPEIVHFNALGKDVLPLNQAKAGMKVSFDGKATWRPRSNIKTRCQLNLRDWPWDTHKCAIHLGIIRTAEMFQLTLFENGIKMEMQKTNPEWTIITLGAESVNTKKPFLIDPDDILDYNSSNNNHSSLTFTLMVKRSNIGLTYTYVIPLSVIVILSLICFWMDPLGYEKLATNCMLITLICAFLLRLGCLLSTSSDYTPYLIKLYCWVLIVVSCATILNVVIIKLVRNVNLSPPPQFICNALTSPTMMAIFFMPKPNLETKSYGQLNEEEEITDASQLVDTDANMFWLLVATFCDRVAFILAIGAYTAFFVHE